MYGWTCPNCRAVYSPNVLRCWTCGKSENSSKASQDIREPRRDQKQSRNVNCDLAAKLGVFCGPTCSCVA